MNQPNQSEKPNEPETTDDAPKPVNIGFEPNVAGMSNHQKWVSNIIFDRIIEFATEGGIDLEEDYFRGELIEIYELLYDKFKGWKPSRLYPPASLRGRMRGAVREEMQIAKLI